MQLSTEGSLAGTKKRAITAGKAHFLTAVHKPGQRGGQCAAAAALEGVARLSID
ncbi:hypothetical protein [Azohydromonas australica]|jgi:hypothetical protein|uniref:hypothetical protein n=1 Tax=Azohydromonas australica TaxID=364039 RepID=UPI00146CC992|nr:hypothetical protein [Azohydromonas australica]